MLTVPADPPSIRTAAVLGWALAFAIVVDLLADGERWEHRGRTDGPALVKRPRRSVHDAEARRNPDASSFPRLDSAITIQSQ